MGDIWQSEKLVIFLIMLVPGFISLKVWDLLVPSERRDFSKSLIDAVAYSAINFALLFWLVDYLSRPNLAQLAPKGFLLGNLALFFLFPVFWPVALLWLMRRPFLSRHIVNAIQKPWDYVFAKREAAWVIVHLKNGGVIGGKFDSKSFASSYPASEQIYIEELWQLDDKRNFARRVDRTKGSIVLGDDILAIEFFE
jgi:hypothetical protein